MKRSVSFTMLFTAIIVIANVSYAQNNGPIQFKELDLNANGAVDKNEFQQKIKTLSVTRPRIQNKWSFDVFDINNDKIITIEEFNQTKMTQGKFSSRRNQRGNTGSSSQAPNYEDFDLDSDGYISRIEFNTARANRIQKRVEQGMPMKNISEAHSFEEIDMNKDGFINHEELNSHILTHRNMLGKQK